MTKKPCEITAITQNVETTGRRYSDFTRGILALNMVACNKLETVNPDLLDKALDESLAGIKALGAKGGLQEMLAAQMFSIHRLQQLSMSKAHEAAYMNQQQSYTNTAIKLANVFVQQAILLSRLQGNGGQKIVVEHVDVHSGGQAIVGTINGSSVNK